MWVLKIINKLQENRIKFAIAGGYAVALHGAVRGTVDLDLVVLLEKANLKKLETALKELKLQSKIPIDSQDLIKFRKEYIEKRNLIAWSFVDPQNPSHIVDIIITHNLNTMKVKNISVYGIKLPILSKESLIKMKRDAGRPQDIEDIKALEALDEKS